MKKIITLFLLLIPCLVFGDNSDCESIYDILVNNTKFKTLEDKIKEINTHEEKCNNIEAHDISKIKMYNKFNKIQEIKKLIFIREMNNTYDVKKIKSMLGDILFQNNNSDELYILSKDLLQKYPDWYGSHYYQGVAYLMQGEFDKSKLSLRKSLNLHYGNFKSHAALSFVYFKQDDICQHLKHWQIAYDINKKETLKFYIPSISLAISLCKQGTEESLDTARYILSFMTYNIEGIEDMETYKSALSLYYQSSKKLYRGISAKKS